MATPSPSRRVSGVSDSPTRDRSFQGLLTAAGVLLASFVLGGLTSYGQTVLPSALHSLANSGSGWTLMTALLVWLARRRVLVSAVLGALSFVLLTVGYAVVSTSRGFYFSPLFWSLVGVVVGPLVGVAASWLRPGGRRLALGAGLLAGIGVGDGLHGLTVVAATTSPVYWTLVTLLGLLLALWGAWRLRRAGLILLEVATLAVAAASLLLTYQLV